MHRSMEYWIAYVENRLSQTERGEAERHLYDCDDCLTMYLRAAEQQPVAWDAERAEAVTAAVISRVSGHGTQTEREWLSRFIHYTVAASLTLLLMASGVFQQLVSYTESWRSAYNVAEQQKPLIADKVINRTSHLLEGLTKQGGYH